MAAGTVTVPSTELLSRLQFCDDVMLPKPELMLLKPGPRLVNVWSYSDFIHKIMDKYKELNPDLDYEIKSYSNMNEYHTFAVTLMASGGPDMPDIYEVNSEFVLRYTKGEAAKHALPYRELGIDVDRRLMEAEIAQYIVDVGTRPSDNEIVALSYKSTGGACIYRRSIAKDIWGTDDPQVIRNKIGPGWDQFFSAAEQLRAKGYSLVSGDGDIWRMVEGGSPTGWIVDGKLSIDPAREKFLDYAKLLRDKDWSNGTTEWHEEWFHDMADRADRKVFCYFGPAWLINVVIDPNSSAESDPNTTTYGDWAICEPLAGFAQEGSWVLANKGTKNRKAVADMLEWITLDTTDTGLQYLWANGFTYKDFVLPKDTVASAAVMRRSDGRLDILGGQDMFDVFIPVTGSVSARNWSMHDVAISTYWRKCVNEYVEGKITRSEAIEQFKKQIVDNGLLN